MARIIPSALIDGITGKFNGDVFQMWRGIIVRKKCTSPRQPRTSFQSSSRQLFSYLSGSYDSLSDSQKSAWTTYAALIGSTLSGFNAFMQLNQQILYANYSTLIRLFDPPPERNNPSSPSGFYIDSTPGSCNFVLRWSTPSMYNYYVQVYSSPLTGYRNTLFPSWLLSQTVNSPDENYIFATSSFSLESQIRFRLRVLNCYGEASAYSETITTVVV